LALEHAQRATNRRREVWTLGIGAWGHLQANRLETAKSWLLRCIERCERIRWLAFEPWPHALIAEVDLALGVAKDSKYFDLENAFAMSCQIGDPCWEAASARSMALARASDGKTEDAINWLRDARRRCGRVTDSWAGLMVAIIADQARISRQSDDDNEANSLMRDLLEYSARTYSDKYLKEAIQSLN
jgi:hypothetical protein